PGRRSTVVLGSSSLGLISMQAAASSKYRVYDSIDRVIAECDRIDAALLQLTQDHETPPLTVKEIAVADGGGSGRRAWAIVSADPQRPLTEWEAKDIVGAMQRPRTPARFAAE